MGAGGYNAKSAAKGRAAAKGASVPAAPRRPAQEPGRSPGRSPGGRSPGATDDVPLPPGDPPARSMASAESDDEVERQFRAEMALSRAPRTPSPRPGGFDGLRASARARTAVEGARPQVASSWPPARATALEDEEMETPMVMTAKWEAKGEHQLTAPKNAVVGAVEVNGHWVWCRYEDPASGESQRGWLPQSYLQPRSTDCEVEAPAAASSGANRVAVPAAPAAAAASQTAGSDGSEGRVARGSADRGLRSGAQAQEPSDDEEEVTPELPEAWTTKLSSTMVLHTVQNAMRLAAYLLKLLTGGYGTASALHIACWEGSADAVAAVTSGKKHLVRDWHERQGDLTPLHIAAICGHCEVVEYLLQLDVDANIPTVHGLRALHISASSCAELSEALVSGGADPTATTADADTPLHFATCYQQLPTMEMLLCNGADAAASNAFGVSPLHIAAAYVGLEGLKIHEANAVLLLLSWKADPLARDRHGRTPADVAIMAGGDNSLVEFLRGGSAASPCRDRGHSEGVAARMQDLASQMMSQHQSGDDQAANGDNTPDDAARLAEDWGEKFAADIRCGAGQGSGVGGVSDLRLAEENSQLSAELSKLTKELKEATSKNQHLEDMLKNARGTMEQMQGLQAAAASAESSSEGNTALQQLQSDLVRERDELRKRNQDLDSERQRWREQREALQKQLDDALAERDSALITAKAETAAAKDRPTSADLRKDQELSQMLGQKDAELEARLRAEQDALEARARAENEAREAIDQKETELGRKDAEIVSLREELEQKSSEIASKTKELARQAATIESMQGEVRSLSADLQKQRREHEEVFDQLSKLRGQHAELRQEYAQAQKSHEQEKEAFRSKEVTLEGRIREQDLCLSNTRGDLEKTQAQVRDLEDCKERAARADRMLAPLNQRIDELHKAFAAEQALRKRYHNQMQEAKGAIRVYARIRPKIAREQGEGVAARRVDAFSMELDSRDKRSPPKNFTFDAIFDEHNSQEDVFADCRGLVSSAVDGYNVTVFAYGQTGAGKTHTMYGSTEAPGLVPRVAEEVFMLLSKYSHEANAKVKCSMFELYRDDLVDLLFQRRKGVVPALLDIKKDTRGSVYVDGATERDVANPAELLKCIEDGQERRHVSATKMNADSSRSHLITIIVIESTNRKTKQVSTGKLTLCDLAGSERLKKSEATGSQLKEAQSINKSLTALGDVIEALTKHAKHVPYRNHKLTQLLSDSLGGNAKTLMFVNCSPAESNSDETGAALGYAARAKLIVNKVEKNQDSQEVARLKKVIQLMSEKEQAGAANGGRALPLEPS